MFNVYDCAFTFGPGVEPLDGEITRAFEAAL